VSWDQFFSYKPEAAYYKQTSTYLLFRSAAESHCLWKYTY